MIAELIAILCAGLFTGAALYVNLVEHPARMETGTELALSEFKPSYRRGAVMQGLLAAIGFVSSLIAWLTGSSNGWLIGGICLGTVIPFTLLVILPTNRKLLDPSLDKSSSAARSLLIRWGRLHAVRTMLGFISFLIFLAILFA